MDIEKVYQDSKGNDCNIVQMVWREPDWAANRIQEGEKAIERLAGMETMVSNIATEFFRYWFNAPGSNTDQGFNDWWEINKSKFGFNNVGLNEGVWFQSKVSGAWYRSHKAAGTVRMVLVDGNAYFQDGA